MAVGEDADAATAAAEARRVVAANAYMTLATADADGRPWATPVWFATRDGGDVVGDFVWVSRPGARHSRNIAVRPHVALVVFDSSVPVGGASALYVEAVAEEVGAEGVGDADRAGPLAAFNERAREQGLDLWDEARLTAGAPFRLYRARAVRSSVLDERDGRIPLV